MTKISKNLKNRLNVLTVFRKDPISLSSLETPITQHCNLRCGACDHASPLLSKTFLDLDQFKLDIHALKSVVDVEEFRLVGGEPLQHPGLLDIINIIRDSGIAKRIVLVTNGVLLRKASTEIWKSIDKLWLSIYPGVSLGLPLEEIGRLCEEHNVKLDARKTDQFRVVLLNNPIDDDELVRDIYRDCKTAHVWKCYTVLNGLFYKCSKASLMKSRLREFGISHDADAVDGVTLHSGRNLHYRLQSYINSREPLPSCSFCLGTSGPLVRHHQLNNSRVQAARKEDHRPLIQQMIADRQTRQKSA